MTKMLCLLILSIIVGCNDFTTTKDFLPLNKQQFSVVVCGKTLRVPLPNSCKFQVLSSNVCWITLGDEAVVYRKFDNFRIPAGVPFEIYKGTATHAAISVSALDMTKVIITGKM